MGSTRLRMAVCAATVLYAPPARNHAAMTHDSRRGCFALYCGHDGINVFGDVWERCGTNDWKRVARTGPRERVPNGH